MPILVVGSHADDWALGWEALASIATGLTFFGGLVIFAADKLTGWRSSVRRRRIIASGLLHTVQLTRNYLRGIKEALAHRANYQQPSDFGAALLHRPAAPLAEHLGEIAEYGEQTACDFAYAVSLMTSIEQFAKWLREVNPIATNDEQTKTIEENATFFAEAASQALESLDAVEEDLKRHVPTHIKERRFGPEPE